LQAFSDTSVVNCTNKKPLNSRPVIEFATAGFYLQQTKFVANEKWNMANNESDPCELPTQNFSTNSVTFIIIQK